MLLNLSQTSGPALAVSVRVLHERLVALRSSDVEADQRASELLEKRGLTPAVLDEARDALTRLSRPPARAAAAPEAGRGATVDELWHWYLEWSQIARAALREPALLRVLGFAGRAAP